MARTAKKNRTLTRVQPTPGQAVIPMDNSGGGQIVTMANGLKFRVTRQVTLPLLKQSEGQVVSVKITSEIYIGREIKADAKGERANEKPADLVRVIELNTNRPMTYIVPAVLKSTLEDEYPKGKDGIWGYIGHNFAIMKHPAAPGKRYKQFEVLEIETDGETE